MPVFSQRDAFFVRAIAGLALLATAPTASAAEALTASEAEQLRFEIRQLKLLNQSHIQKLQQMENRLNQLEPSAEPSLSKSKSSTVASNTAPTKRSADPTASVENILLEEHTLFTDKFTFEVGMDYTHYDRKQLALDGFLALDAIFLGDIAVDDINADIFTWDFNGRYNINKRWQLGASIPFIYRTSTYQKNFVTDSDAATGEVRTIIDGSTDGYGLGDITLTSAYQLFAETQSRPDIVWNLSVKAPTGKDPYGVDTKIVEDDNGNRLEIPKQLPTGSGMWSLSTGLSFLKTTDPAILFANVGYTHNFSKNFGGDTGEIRLGDSFNYGVGIAFAMNERMSLSMALSHRINLESEQNSSKIIGSDGNAATFTTGVTYALSNRLSMLTSVGVGLTPDASDFSIGIKFPYRF
ncbi:transporter [Marinobacterium stanieri]|uniref:MetA-pathway of phenol degradation n=1 Tax=Marinobacterium stanieri TaxID=49186 RepID=A0A1N6X7Y9_9GAMM|nr:transporter [Marinobacterium stanieri]SIQ98426.1 hypothetical protein SAMN05421647_1136 [Marinobacterium stanieri]